MISRRGFLKVTLAAGVMPALAHADTLAGGDRLLAIVVEPACADMREFLATSTQPVLRTANAGALMDALGATPLRRCFGLSCDSQFFLVEQMAAALGYRLAYHGVHDYRDGRLRHQLTGARAAVDELAQAFAQSGAAWSTALAHALPQLARTRARGSQAIVVSDTPRPTDSGGYLVSWCLHRA